MLLSGSAICGLSIALMLLAALILDALVGDLPRLFSVVHHPVALVGKAIAFLDRRLNRPDRGRRKLLIRGLLVTAVEVVDKFVQQGVIVSTHGRSSREDFTYSAHAGGTWGVPLVVLIDQDSASAAEIFAGAIRDHRRGTIVGQRSFGKGSVQGIFPLNTTTAGVRLTTAKFYSPNGRPFSGVGVEPDLTVHQVARPVYGAVVVPVRPGQEDPMLGAALQAARQLTAQR